MSISKGTGAEVSDSKFHAPDLFSFFLKSHYRIRFPPCENKSVPKRHFTTSKGGWDYKIHLGCPINVIIMYYNVLIKQNKNKNKKSPSEVLWFSLPELRIRKARHAPQIGA